MVGNLFPDPEARAEAEQKLAAALMAHSAELHKAQAEIISAEAKSEHWLAAVWRPILMLTIIAIIANNYVLAPYVALFFGVDVVLVLPDHLWDLLKIGVGGYIVGRSGEKIVREVRK